MESHSDKHSTAHHIIPHYIYTRVMWALIAFTLVTVGFHYLFHDLLQGSTAAAVLAAPVAFLIALFKASLVLMFFMGLKYDKPDNRIIFSTGFFFLALLFFICMLDIYTRIAQTSTL